MPVYPAASLAALFWMQTPVVAGPAQDYAQYCAECHGTGRLGALGPAMIPETLKRMRGPNLTEVIRNGRPATQMTGFGDILDEATQTLGSWQGKSGALSGSILTQQLLFELRLVSPSGVKSKVEMYC